MWEKIESYHILKVIGEGRSRNLASMTVLIKRLECIAKGAVVYFSSQQLKKQIRMCKTKSALHNGLACGHGLHVFIVKYFTSVQDLN